MKVLYGLIPIGMWVGNYFLWKFAAQYMEAMPTVAGVWWFVTCIIFVVFTVASLGYAIIKMEE